MQKIAVNMMDVAKEAGVSMMTVSLALRGHSKISKATAKRVREIAERMGYRPNPLVSALVSDIRSRYKMKTPPVIGFISSYEERNTWWLNEVQRSYYEGAKARAEKLGFGFELFEVAVDGMTPRRLNNILSYRKVCGLICGPLPDVSIDLELDWEAFPAVALGYSMREPAIHRITHNHYQSMSLTLQRLDDLGYKRIGIISAEWATVRTSDLYIGALEAYQRRIPVSNRIPWLALPINGIRVDLILNWIQQQKCDVVVDASFNALDYIFEQSQITLPKGLAYATLSWRREKPENTGIEQNSFIVGEVAVNTLVSQIYANERGVPSTQTISLVNGKWMEGKTVPPKKKVTRRAKSVKAVVEE